MIQSEYLKGFLLTALGVIFLSFDALFIRLIGSESSDVLFWRGILISFIIAIGCKIKYPGQALFSLDWSYIRSAVLFAISTISFVMAIHLTTVANVLVIISAQPLFAALLSRIFLAEKSPPITWIAIFISILGIAWVVKDSWQAPNLQGDLLALLCSLALSSKFVNDRAASHRNMIPALITGSLIIAVFAFFSSADGVMLEGIQWLWTLILCFIILPLAYIFITLGPTRIPAAEVGMLMLLETVIGPIWVWLFIDEIPSSTALQGGLVVIVTLFIHAILRFNSQKKRSYT